MNGLLPKSVAEQLLYSTVRIVGDSGTGTGFFFHFKLNDTSRVELILTNKHVWIPHPNKDVDLGALLFVTIRNHAKNVMQKNIYALFLDDNLIRE
jgi:hypothetical protein